MSICASEPIGSARPRLTSSTPAISVDDDGAEADGEDAEAPVGRLHGRGWGSGHGRKARGAVPAHRAPYATGRYSRHDPRR